MSARLRVRVLGCGASPGVPRIGPDWGACDPNEPKNRRSRCSILLERFEHGDEPTRVLVDTGPDMREQLLRANVAAIDAVIYTHPHADHIHGIDDLRAFWLSTRRRVPVYSDEATGKHLLSTFSYCFEMAPGSNYPPILEHTTVDLLQPFHVTGAGGTIVILPFHQVHGDSMSLGLRVDGFAYSSDVSDLPEASIAALDGLDTWMVDALRPRPHPSHFNVEQALAWIERIDPQRAVLTHLHGDLDYATLKGQVPARVDVAYDGMQMEFSLGQ